MYVNLARRIPLATTFLIAINIIILGLGLVSGTQLQVIRDYGFLPYTLFHINNNLPDIITRLFSSIFIHSGIAHLAFNILALAYIGAYSERSVGLTRYVLIYILSDMWYLSEHQVQFQERNSCCYWKYKSILLAGIANYIRHIWFVCRVSNCIHCAYWWLSCRSNSYQNVCNYWT